NDMRLRAQALKCADQIAAGPGSRAGDQRPNMPLLHGGIGRRGKLPVTVSRSIYDNSKSMSVQRFSSLGSARTTYPFRAHNRMSSVVAGSQLAPVLRFGPRPALTIRSILQSS